MLVLMSSDSYSPGQRRCGGNTAARGPFSQTFLPATALLTTRRRCVAGTTQLSLRKRWSHLPPTAFATQDRPPLAAPIGRRDSASPPRQVSAGSFLP